MDSRLLWIGLLLLVAHCLASPDVKRKPFYVVAAPESAGNRYVVRLLLTLGCVGRSSHHQPFDLPSQFRQRLPGMTFSQYKRRQDNTWVHTLDFATIHKHYTSSWCFVVHRSLPHALAFLNLTDFLVNIATQGFEPRLITVVRNKYIMALSQLRETHVDTLDEAYGNIERAGSIVARAIIDLPWLWHRSVIYTDFAHEQAVTWFFERDLGMAVPTPRSVVPVFVDEDIKYYENLTMATDHESLKWARMLSRVEAMRVKPVLPL